MNDVADRADRSFADLLARVRDDPSVQGVLVHGSRAFEGMPTANSDYDLIMFVDESEPAESWPAGKAAGLDVYVSRSLSDFRSAILRRDDTERYILAHAHVLVDRLDGSLAALVAEAATFPDRRRRRLPTMLDAYLNLFYRSVKNWRDGYRVEAHLDAAASIDLALWVIFAMHERLRPPNKYLRWELRRHPLGDGPWAEARLLERVRRILADGDADAQRALFRDIEAMASTRGLSDTVDAWGTDLALMRGAPGGA